MIEPETPPVFNPADYPRKYVYKESWPERLFALTVITAMIIALIFGLIHHFYVRPLPGDLLFFVLIMPPIMLICLLLVKVTNTVELTEHNITVRSGRSTRTLSRSDILGWKEKWNGWESQNVITIVPTHRSARKIVLLTKSFKKLKADDALHAWYQSLPDLYKPAKDKYFDAIGQCASLGGDYTTRLRNMGKVEKIVQWAMYSAVAITVYFWLIPNAYLLPLPSFAAIGILILIFFSILLIFKYPVLLLRPLPADIRKKFKADALVSLWGFLFCAWLLRYLMMRHTEPDIFSLQFNYYYLALIYLLLSLHLIADKAWKEVPLRFLNNAPLTICAVIAFYTYGNMALDQTTKPVIKHAHYALSTFGPADSKIPFGLDRQRDGKIVTGCAYWYPGAFGTPWRRLGPCPVNFQIPRQSK